MIPDTEQHNQIPSQQGVNDVAPFTGIPLSPLQEMYIPQAQLPDAKESAEPFHPKPRIATFDMCFCEDDAISLNGRQYPREIVDKLIASAQRTLADTNQPPITCYINHNESDKDDTLKLVGKIVKVWREGKKAMASIDIPDTTAGRDVAALVAHRYIITQSLRASGVTLAPRNNRGMPQVVEAPGETATLQGIDFTSTPGLDKTARIGKVLLETADLPGITDAFEILVQEQVPMLKENVALQPIVSGDSQSTDGTPAASSGNAHYPAPSLVPSGSAPNLPAHPAMQEAHDRAAAMLNLPCKNGANEHGKVLNKENAAHAASIHDGMAEALNKPCVGHGTIAANSMQHFHTAPTSTDPDGDNDMDSSKESHNMTPEEMLEALRASGYKVEAPKTQAQVLQEQITAQDARLLEMQATQTAALEKLTQLLEAKTAPPAPVLTETLPVRRSLVESGTNYREPPANARRQSYVKECLDRMTDGEWAALADRTKPLPAHIVDPKNPKAGLERMVREMGHFALAKYDEKYGLA